MSRPYPEKPTDAEMRDAAKRLYGQEGAVEIDENAVISRADHDPENGAYVQAWVWVYNADARSDKKG